jgi:pre-mRNA-splicing helicase BRR2
MFLHVDEKKGLFYFDASYRPFCLQRGFTGITEKKAIRRYQVMNEVLYKKVLDQDGEVSVRYGSREGDDHGAHQAAWCS